VTPLKKLAVSFELSAIELVAKNRIDDARLNVRAALSVDPPHSLTFTVTSRIEY
jgi:hypothetical protein